MFSRSLSGNYLGRKSFPCNFAAFFKMDTQKHALISSCLKLFQRHGLKAVTMDQIAQELGVSKKTVYRHVPNKKELVQACCTFSVQETKEKLAELVAESDNAIDELLRIDRMMREKLEAQRKNMEGQLNAQFPEAHQKLSEERTEMILAFQRSNLQRGVDERLYRPEIDRNVVAKVYLSKIQGILDQSGGRPLIPGLSKLLGEAMVYHLHGIATKKGIEYLKKRMNE